MRIRNLAMFFPDDTPISERAHFIDVNDTPMRWEGHCREIFRQNLLEFDFLSSDINFREDKSDPCAGNTLEQNSAGLVHALAGLARRQALDGHGNQLPLAWEMRSMTPHFFRKEPDAIRVYGLLRSLAARPRKDETLEDCIWREYEEMHDDFLPHDREDWKDQPLSVIMAGDLAAQKQRTSNLSHAVGRLLPRWRVMLLDSIVHGQCVVHHSTALQQVRRLADACKGGAQSIPRQDPPIFLPIGDRFGNACYGIDLFSIFSDRVTYDPMQRTWSLNVAERPTSNPRLRGPGDWRETSTVLDWFTIVTELAGSTKLPPRKVLAKTCDEVIRMLDARDPDDRARGGEDALSCFVRDSDGEVRAMVYCFMVAHSIIVHDNCNFGQKHLDSLYKLDFTNPQTWGRNGLKQNPKLFPSNPATRLTITPEKFGKMLYGAMKGNGHDLLGKHWDWMREGLVDWLERPANAALLGRARKRAPGLFEV
ncbi:hypothetical protein [Asticcacaulis solisilvae]|uniref:hypothetical protein n=1 Tax=Asticcacaulis solisilvae TaxID=1217274 RepID=UPI003FD87163